MSNLQNNFSTLANYGDLSKYKLNEIDDILCNWDKNIKFHRDYFDVTWTNEFTSITIRYESKQVKFNKILKEEWKNFNLKFIRTL
jgi:hypothetical protein